MTKHLLIALGFATFFSGCGQNIPSLNTNVDAECERINKNLFELQVFHDKVEGMSAFHLEEAAVALQKTQFTTSTNKPQMLRDMAKRKAELEAEHQKYNCATLKQ